MESLYQARHGSTLFSFGQTHSHSIAPDIVVPGLRYFQFTCADNLRFSTTLDFGETLARRELRYIYIGDELKEAVGLARKWHDSGI
jgi:hypothetical protein